MKGVKGMPDILCEDVKKYRWIENQAQEVLSRYCFEEIRLPILEKQTLFSRGVGEGCDIVQKEMYTLEDRKGEVLALRPEGTASVVRSVLEHKLYAQSENLKLFYCGAMFRYERPQSGRQRQFYQLGAELFGYSSVFSDFEMICLFWDIAQAIDIPNCILKINTLGGPSSKEKFQKVLRQHIQQDLSLFCEDCSRRYELNVLRVLDCKNPRCKEQVALYDLSLYRFLETEDQESFEKLCLLLEQSNIPFEHSENLVRGLDYYTGTVFELETDSLTGSHNVIGAGGRYDGLVKSLGGPSLPAVGFAFGLERLYLASRFLKQEPCIERNGVFFVFFDPSSLSDLIPLIQKLRTERKVRVAWDLSGEKSVKSQMRLASKEYFKYVLLYGDEERDKQHISVKNLEDGTQERIPQQQLFDFIK